MRPLLDELIDKVFERRCRPRALSCSLARSYSFEHGTDAACRGENLDLLRSRVPL